MACWWHDGIVSDCICGIHEDRNIGSCNGDEILVDPRFKQAIEIYNPFSKNDADSTCDTLTPPVERVGLHHMCSFELEDVDRSVRSRSTKRPLPFLTPDSRLEGLEDMPIDRNSSDRISLSRIAVPSALTLDIPSVRDGRQDAMMYDDEALNQGPNDEDALCMPQTEVTFDLANGKLGSELGRFRSFLLILDIKPGCLMDQFNKTMALSHDAQYGPIEIGDQILACDEETKPRRMLAQMTLAARLKEKVTLEFRKRMKRFTMILDSPSSKYDNPNVSLGLSCNVVGHVVRIVGLRKGLVTEWCHDHPVRSVCVGDYIEEVNGFVGSDIIVALEDWLAEPDGHLRMVISAA